jgi:hypothetical protein
MKLEDVCPHCHGSVTRAEALRSSSVRTSRVITPPIADVVGLVSPRTKHIPLTDAPVLDESQRPVCQTC